jgi:PAS domain-containing protein
MTEATRQRSIVLILARDLASTLATPTMIVDADGRVVYYNDAAGYSLGRPFNEAAPMTREQVLEAVHTMDENGLPVDFADTPLGIVLTQRRPSHQVLTMTDPDGVTQPVEVTAFPLYARPDELVGGVAVFWTKRRER